jgi:hypothetical protein
MFNSSENKFILTEEGLPIIEASIQFEQNIRHGFFYIDTCSSINIIDESYVNGDGLESSFRGLGDSSNKAIVTNVRFRVGDNYFEEKFHAIRKKSMPKEDGYSILGILGIGFMNKNKILYNNYQQIIYMNNNSELFDSRSVIKMEYTNAGLPLIKTVFDGKEQWCLVDTGAAFSIACEPVFGDFTFQPVSHDKENLLWSFGDKVMTLPATVDFSVILDGVDKSHNIHYHEEFSVPVCGNKKYLDIDKEREIRVLLGNDFLRRHQWILDFGNNVIYVK